MPPVFNRYHGKGFSILLVNIWQLHTGILYLNSCLHSFWKTILSATCGVTSPSFESTTVLYITPTNSASMQQLVIQDRKQKQHKTYSRCRKDIWLVESKHLMRTPTYVNITLNIFNYINNIIMSLIPLDLNIILGPYKLSLQTTVDDHENYIYALWSLNYFCLLLWKTFYCNDNRIRECNISNTRDSQLFMCYWTNWSRSVFDQTV